MAMGVEEGAPVQKAASNSRSYKLIKLPNGLAALLIHDPEVSTAEEEGNMDTDADADADAAAAADSSDGEREEAMEGGGEFPWPSLHTCTGVGGAQFNLDVKPRLRFHPDEEGSLKSAVFHSSKRKDEESDSGSTKKPKGTWATKEGVVIALGNAEHMLFMGNTKFPDENEYDKFLSKHGGASNAYTDQEFTCYHFDVRNQCFKDALERFSQFFISPLIKAEAMDREIQAIESEFVQALANDMNRLAQVQCFTALPNHPVWHGFSWGNKKSLGDEPKKRGVDMRAKLLKLYGDHYRGGRMKLVVLGGESLETLQKWVVELFSGVREGGNGRLTWQWEGRIWEPQRLYRIAAGRELSLVSINWPLPCLEGAYQRKPQDYFGHLIGHEGAGSLLSLLKKKGWGRHVMAGCGDNGHETNSLVFLFNVTVILSNQGLDHVLEVIGLVYQYVKMLKQAGPQEWVFQEQKDISTLNFLFAEEGAPDEYAMGLATNMHLYSEEHVIYGDYSHDVWDPELVTSVLARFTPNNMRLDLLCHNFDRKAPGVQIEPWFETPFTVEVLPADLVAGWADPPAVDPALQMPVPNEFIPRDFAIHLSRGPAPEHPRCLVDSAALRVWHRNDTKFRTPRTNACFSIICHAATRHLGEAVLAQLYVNYLTSQLNEMLYLANVAKLETSISLSGYRIELKMFGFSEKLPVLAQKIAQRMKELVLTPPAFEETKECMLEEYKRANEKPIDHAAYLSMQALSKRFWDIDHRSACLRGLAFPDYTKFNEDLFSKTYIECLLHGNLLKKNALAIAKVFKEALVSSPLPLEERPVNRVVKLPAGTSLLYKEACKNAGEKNSVVQSYFQIGQYIGNETTRLRCLIDLFETIISEPFFNQLRTQEQLGYIVDSGCQDIHRVLGFNFLVQSAQYSPAYIEARINAFIAQIPAMLSKMTDEEFKDHKDSLIAQKLELACSLYEETERHWEQIWEGRYHFDEGKSQAAELEKVKKNELVNWCRHYLGPRSNMRRHLSIHVIGRNAREGLIDDGKAESSLKGPKDAPPRRIVVIDDLEEYKKRLEVYPARL